MNILFRDYQVLTISYTSQKDEIHIMYFTCCKVENNKD